LVQICGADAAVADPVEESAEVVVRMTTVGAGSPTGTFEEDAGQLGW
jgi:hypothetical protein